ncbi:hypothetical protein V1514DRAFT_320344 [Lipomyces japonicus]|uniref:uncharacterized protein n=1 Tax=Lipomyces japonicus TaxID=56871 RepID=UPI0034CE7AB4
MGILDLENQLSFYMAYHHNHVNILIHTICVPVILFTSFALASNTGSLLPASLASAIDQSWIIRYFNLGVLASLAYAIFYVLLDPIIGSIVLPVVIGSAVVFTDLIDQYAPLSNYVALILFVISWILQFVGHAAFEHRAPALFDNLLQALVLAPFFVTFEIVFKFGFRQELQARLNDRVQKRLREFNNAQRVATKPDQKQE